MTKQQTTKLLSAIIGVAMGIGWFFLGVWQLTIDGVTPWLELVLSSVLLPLGSFLILSNVGILKVSTTPEPLTIRATGIFVGCMGLMQAVSFFFNHHPQFADSWILPLLWLVLYALLFVGWGVAYYKAKHGGKNKE